MSENEMTREHHQQLTDMLGRAWSDYDEADTPAKREKVRQAVEGWARMAREWETGQRVREGRKREGEEQ